MNFEKIQPYKNAAWKCSRDVVHWISEIYKISVYHNQEGKAHYAAYYIPSHFNNWGDYVSRPPEHINIGNGMTTRGWNKLSDAKKACKQHAKTYNPTKGQIEAAYRATNQLKLMETELGTIINCPVCNDETRKDYPYGVYCSHSCQRQEDEGCD